MWSALEMYDSLLAKLLSERGTRSQHRRSKLAFLTEYTVRHANIRILESD